MHLDALGDAVVEGQVGEGLGLEVGVNAAVDDAQDVPVELGGNSSGVVVRHFQRSHVLDQVDAQQEQVAGSEKLPYLREKVVPSGSVQVANGASKEEDEPPAGAWRNLRQVTLEIADDGVHVQGRVCIHELDGRRLQRVGVDVDRNVPCVAAEAVHRVEKSAGLGAGSGADLHDVLGTKGAD